VIYIIFILKKSYVYIVEPKRIREKKSCPEISFTPFSILGKKFTFFYFKSKRRKGKGFTYNRLGGAAR
jgi:hypothetical protein